MIYRNGNELQKVCVITTLTSNTLSLADTLKLFRSFIQEIPKETPMIQVNAASSFKSWLPNSPFNRSKSSASATPVTPAQVLAIDDLYKPMKDLCDCRNKAIQSLWMDCVLELVPFLSRTKLEKDVVSDAIQNTNMMQAGAYRQWACKILGKVARCLEAARAESLLIEVTVRLCQDTDMEIRQCMASQIPAICDSINSKPGTIIILLDELLELMKDEERKVADTALNSLIDCMELAHNDKMFDKDLRRKIVNPAIRRAYAIVDGARVSNNLVKNIGRALVYMVSDPLTPNEEILGLLKWAVNAGKTNDTQIRSMLAFNIPAILKIANEKNTTSPMEFLVVNAELDSLLLSLARDNNLDIRLKIARGLHAACKALDENSLERLGSVYKKLIEDENIQVILAVYEKLDVILSSFAKNQLLWLKQSASLDKQSSQSQMYGNNGFLDDIMKITRSLLTMDKRLSKHFQVELFATWSNFSSAFTQEQIYCHLISFLLNVLKEGTSLSFECETAIIRLLVHYMRGFTKLLYKESILVKMSDSFLPSVSTYRHRIIYLRFVEVTLTRFSARYFKKNLWSSTLCLKDDPVIAVRYKVASMLPLITMTVTGEQDSEKFNTLRDMIVEWKSKEIDKGVLRVLNEFHSNHTVTDDWRAHDTIKEREEDEVVENEKKKETDVQNMRDYSRKVVGSSGIHRQMMLSKKAMNNPLSSHSNLKSVTSIPTLRSTADMASSSPKKPPAAKLHKPATAKAVMRTQQSLSPACSNSPISNSPVGSADSITILKDLSISSSTPPNKTDKYLRPITVRRSSIPSVPVTSKRSTAGPSSPAISYKKP